ncbi:MAG: hypothetical protein QM426_02955 [Euryarchaeota archaeon]|nr:hypothetical protein [Euryarchaeota archaeon]
MMIWTFFIDCTSLSPRPLASPRDINVLFVPVELMAVAINSHPELHRYKVFGCVYDMLKSTNV